MNLDDITKMLHPPVKRDDLVEIIASGMVLKPTIKALAYVVIQGMSQSDLDKMAQIALEAVKAAKNGDMESLDTLMKQNNVPQQFSEVVKQYATHLSQ